MKLSVTGIPTPVTTAPATTQARYPEGVNTEPTNIVNAVCTTITNEALPVGDR